MILQLQMPFIGPAARSVRMLRWYKGEGDHIDYGDPICDLLVEEVVRLQWSRSAKAAQRNAPPRVVQTTQSGDVAYRVRVIASDRGYLRVIRSREREPVEVGSVLALATSEAHEPLGEVGDRVAAFRVVPDLLDSGSEEEEA